MKQGRRKRNVHKAPQFNPEWIEAFMIWMLHTIGGDDPDKRKVTLSVAQLEAFTKASHGKKTRFDYDEKTQSITISAPEYELPNIVIVKPGLQLSN